MESSLYEIMIYLKLGKWLRCKNRMQNLWKGHNIVGLMRCSSVTWGRTSHFMQRTQRWPIHICLPQWRDFCNLVEDRNNCTVTTKLLSKLVGLHGMLLKTRKTPLACLIYSASSWTPRSRDAPRMGGLKIEMGCYKHLPKQNLLLLNCLVYNLFVEILPTMYPKTTNMWLLKWSEKSTQRQTRERSHNWMLWKKTWR